MMKTLKIERLEGIYAICTDKEQPENKHKAKDKQRFFGIQISELPNGAAPGDTVEIDEETGALTIVKPKKQ
jgi:hypothetical protein